MNIKTLSSKQRKELEKLKKNANFVVHCACGTIGYFTGQMPPMQMKCPFCRNKKG